VTAGNGSTISLGNGNDTVTGGSNDTITAGNGQDDVTAGADSKITLGNGNDMVAAGSGSTISLGNGNNTVTGGSNDGTTVGNGQNQLVAAPGDVWTVGNGQDTFTFNAGFGNNTITDFNTSRDVLQFNHALFANYMAAMADTKQVGANTVITYDANDSVTLNGVTASHLAASNFKST
jgi:Ca2+-binding RTX toxin-like protein